MHDSTSLRFVCSEMQEVVPAYNRLLSELPPGDRSEFAAAFRRFLTAFPWEEICGRVNGLSVAQLIEESRRLGDPGVVASGEREGVKFALYENPDTSDRPA